MATIREAPNEKCPLKNERSKQIREIRVHRIASADNSTFNDE
jgi:hypothetical protein